MSKYAKAGLSSERLARIRPLIEKHIDKKKILGAVTLLFRNGEIVHLESYGLMDRKKNKPMKEDSIFRVWTDKPLAEFIEDLLNLPLAFQPGTAWQYSVSHDVFAYLMEIMSGKPLDVYFRKNLFEPLGMVDTAFYAHNVFRGGYRGHVFLDRPERGIHRYTNGTISARRLPPDSAGFQGDVLPVLLKIKEPIHLLSLYGG